MIRRPKIALVRLKWSCSSNFEVETTRTWKILPCVIELMVQTRRKLAMLMPSLHARWQTPLEVTEFLRTNDIMLTSMLPPFLINVPSFTSFTNALDSNCDRVISLFNTTYSQPTLVSFLGPLQSPSVFICMSISPSDFAFCNSNQPFSEADAGRRSENTQDLFCL